MIELKNVTKLYGESKGIEEFDFHFEKGNVYGLIGPNGAGKTTLIKLLVNFIHKDGGVITKNFSNNTMLHNISYMPEFNMLIPGTVKKNIDFFSLTYDDMDFDVLYRVLEKFKISLDEKASKLSTGKSKAFRFALTISRKVDVYIFDEPFSGIDVITRKEIVEDIIKEVDILNSLVIISSHELHDMDRLLDYVLLIDQARLVTSKSVEEIKSENHKSLYDWFVNEVTVK
jgi:ABC-2 type transport system ATP-binding protein